MSDYTYYSIEKKGPIAWVYLNRPGKKMALEIADCSPLAVQASKDVLNHGIGKSIHDGLKYVASMSTNIIPSDDLLEAITAFSEKRKPIFTGK